MSGIPLLWWINRKPEEEKGAYISFLVNSRNEKSGNGLPFKGLMAAGIGNGSGDFKGLMVAGIVNSSGDLNGVGISGVANLCDGKLTGLSIGSINYAKNNGRYSFQIGAINYISEYDDAGTTIQVGLSNHSGNQSIPLLNIRRKKKGLEEKTKHSK